jgi:Uma2 family endonuclease
MFAVQEEVKSKQIEINETEKFPLYRLRVDDYEKMIEYGIFTSDDKIELWEGILVKMSPKGINHSTAMSLAVDYFYANLRKESIIRVQDPIRLDDFSEPEPDVVLAKLPLDNYFLSHPTPENILLVLEIAESKIARDREKALNYGRNGVIQYLILNLNTREVEDYREPGKDGYKQKRTYKASEKFTLAAFSDFEFEVKELLPPEQTN